MKKQKGFTLIELMVVMAIIAILATAGLSAYTGYIKKARDATRIADLNAINAIVLASMTSTGLFPANAEALSKLIKENNNGQPILDPLASGTVHDYESCFHFEPDGEIGTGQCVYWYSLCDDGTGYYLATSFESLSNQSLYSENSCGNAPDIQLWGYVGAGYYDLGSCNVPIDENVDYLENWP